MTPSSTADQRAFERLVTTTRDDLLAYALRRSQTPEDAADVLSETYLIAWRKLENIPLGDQARLWLFGVARNVIRRSAQRRTSTNALVQRLAREIRHASELAPIPEDNPAVNALHAALASLTARDREILTLTAWEGLTPQEIATVIHIPANLVRVRLHRARRRVATRLTNARVRSPTPDSALLEREL